MLAAQVIRLGTCFFPLRAVIAVLKSPDRPHRQLEFLRSDRNN